MRRSFLILFLFISLPCFSQTESDSAVFMDLLRNTQNELQEMSRQYNLLRDSFDYYKNETRGELNRLREEDSIRMLYIEELNLAVDSLQYKMQETREVLRKEKEDLKQEIHRIRKGNATLLIIIFSLLVINFVYLLYRNYRLKLFVNNELLNTSLEIERKHNKQQKKLKKKFNSFSNSMDKKLKKWRKKKK